MGVTFMTQVTDVMSLGRGLEGGYVSFFVYFGIWDHRNDRRA